MRTRRHFVGFDTDAGYVDRARLRVAAEASPIAGSEAGAVRVQVPPGPAIPPGSHGQDRLARALREGHLAKDVARILLGDCGFVDIRSRVKLPGLGVELSFTALDRTGRRWAFDVSGVFTATSGGLKRSDALWKALATAAVLHSAAIELPLVLLTTDVPSRRSAGVLALEAVTGPERPVHDVVELLDPAGHDRLRGLRQPRRSEPPTTVRCGRSELSPPKGPGNHGTQGDTLGSHGGEHMARNAGASTYLGVSQRTLYRLIDQGHVADYQMGRVIRLKKEDLDGYLERARIEPGALRHLYPVTDGPDKEDGTESP